jgi:hypothetical protein
MRGWVITILVLFFIIVLFVVFLPLRSEYYYNMKTTEEYACVLTIFKNEGHVLHEWIDHYLKEGMDHLFMIDNGSDDVHSLASYLQKYRHQITVLREASIKPQQQLLQEAYDKHIRGRFRWCFIGDLDEFLYANRGDTVRDFLLRTDKDYPHLKCIAVPWKMFGSSGHTTQPSSVVGHFLYRDHDVHYNKPEYPSNNVKCIFRPFSFHKINLHTPEEPKELLRAPYAAYIDDLGKKTLKGVVTPFYEYQNGPRHLNDSFLHLNHYAIQSKEFFDKIKKTRGSFNKHNRIRNDQYFKDHDTNLVRDDQLRRKREQVHHKPDLVIARFKEDLSFLDDDWFRSRFQTIYVYNKGPPFVRKHPSDIVVVVPLENLGNSGHTYFYHLCRHYPLKNTTVFTAASFMWIAEKKKIFFNTLEKAARTGDSVVYLSDTYATPESFTMASYHFTHPKNKAPDGKTTLSYYRPFRRWYDTVVGGEYPRYFSYKGIFALSPRHQRHRSVDELTVLSDRLWVKNPEEDHFLERTWAYYFRLPPECMFWQERGALPEGYPMNEDDLPYNVAAVVEIPDDGLESLLLAMSGTARYGRMKKNAVAMMEPRFHGRLFSELFHLEALNRQLKGELYVVPEALCGKLTVRPFSEGRDIEQDTYLSRARAHAEVSVRDNTLLHIMDALHPSPDYRSLVEDMLEDLGPEYDAWDLGTAGPDWSRVLQQETEFFAVNRKRPLFIFTTSPVVSIDVLETLETYNVVFLPPLLVQEDVRAMVSYFLCRDSNRMITHSESVFSALTVMQRELSLGKTNNYRYDSGRIVARRDKGLYHTDSDTPVTTHPKLPEHVATKYFRFVKTF